MSNSLSLEVFIIERYWPVVSVELCENWRLQSYKHLAMILQTLPGKHLPDLTKEVCRQWFAVIRSKCPPPTANKILVRAKHLVKTAVEWDLLDVDHMAAVKKAKEDVREYVALPDEKRSTGEPMPFVQSSVGAQLLSTIHGPFQQYVIFGYYTGARRGSLYRLERQDVDLRQGVIRFAKTKTRRAYSIPIHQDLYEPIGELLQMHWPLREYEVERWKASAYFLHHYKNVNSVSRMFGRHRNKVGLKGFRYHDFRHNVGGKLGDAGASTRVIMDMLGHSTVAMSVKYTRVKKDTVRMALETAL